MKIGKNQRHEYSGQSEPEHDRGGRVRLVPRGGGLFRGRLLSQADQFVEPFDDALTDPQLGPLFGRKARKRFGEFFFINGVKGRDLGDQFRFASRVDDGGDAREGIVEIVPAFRVALVEGPVMEQRVFFPVAHLGQERLEEAFALVDAGGIDGQGLGAEPRDQVKLGQGKEAYNQEERDQGALGDHDTRKYGKPHAHLSIMALQPGHASRQAQERFLQTAES